MSKTLNTRQAISILKKDDNYIHHHDFGKSEIHDGCGDTIAEISRKVFTKLLDSGAIKFAAESTYFWSKGYFKATYGKPKR